MTSQTSGPSPAAAQRPAHRLVIGGLLAVAMLSLGGASWFMVLRGGSSEGLGELLTLLAALNAYLVVGLLLIARTPRNPLGWVMTAIGIVTNVGSFTASYAEYALGTLKEPLPGATFAAWFNAWWWFPLISMVFVFVPLLFPSGKPVTPRWRWVTWLSMATVSAIAILAPLNPVLSGDTYDIPNPIGVAAVGDIEESAVGSALFFFLIICALLALISLIVRFRRSRGVERQQMKWFVFGASVIIVMTTYEEMMVALELERFTPQSNVIFGISVAALPVAIGIAVLRYRLYEIDRIISRTLGYGVVTAVLVALYLAAVTSLTALTAPVTGESPVAVAAATLLAAAAFGPVRRRVQAAVDRRFNRARYDAARTVEHYRSRIRDEVDLSSVASDLLAAVGDSVQPARTTLWLRDAGAMERAT